MAGATPGLADIARTPVRVPDWINSKKEPLTVLFSDAALQSITDLNVDKVNPMLNHQKSFYLKLISIIY